MKNQNIYVSIAIVIVALALGIYIGRLPVAPRADDAAAQPSQGTNASADSGDKSFALSCDAKKGLTLTFHLPEDKSVDVTTNDGRAISLANTSTPAAASYTSADGKTVLSLDGTVVKLSESGVPTYQNCVLDAGTGTAGTAE